MAERQLLAIVKNVVFVSKLLLQKLNVTVHYFEWKVKLAKTLLIELLKYKPYMYVNN